MLTSPTPLLTAGWDLASKYPHIHAWLGNMMEREGVRKGMDVPDPSWLWNSKAREEVLAVVKDRAQTYGLALGM